MLKISVTKGRNGMTTLRLEGNLMGQWVHELRTICENHENTGGHTTLDLERLSFICTEGLLLLKDLSAQGVAFANPTPFVREQLKGVGLVCGS